MSPVRECRKLPLPQAVRSLLTARTSDALCVVGPDYRIVYWNTQAEYLTGLLSEEVVGKQCYEMVLGEQENGNPFCTHDCSVMHLCQAKRPVSSFEMRISSRWQAKRWVEVSILSVDSEEGPYVVHLMRGFQKVHETLEQARRVIELSSKREASELERRNAPELAPRQSEILKLLSEGKSTEEIGQELYLSKATVRNHIRSLLQALGAHSQLEALAKARKLGLLS